LRNQIVAHIFATSWFRKKICNDNETGYFSGNSPSCKAAIIALIALQAMTTNTIAENLNTTSQARFKTSAHPNRMQPT
jgi:hypothetical protein